MSNKPERILDHKTPVVVLETDPDGILGVLVAFPGTRRREWVSAGRLKEHKEVRCALHEGNEDE